MNIEQPARAPIVKRPIVERVAGWSVRHRKITVAGWLLLVVATFMLGQRLGTANLNSYDPGQAGKAERILASSAVPKYAGESVLIQTRSPGQAFRDDPEARQAAAQLVTALRHLPRSAATDIRSPLTSPSLINGRSALVTFDVPGDSAQADKAVVPAQNAVAAAAARHPGLIIEEAGGASLDRAVGATVSQDFRKAEVTSVPISLVLLLIVFGALVAAGIPLLLAGTAVISAISLLAIPSHWLPIGSTTSSIVLLVGMAVGIDYSLFYLRRVREERAAGQPTREAVRIAAATSGRAIAVSGLTVMISLSGLFLTGFDAFSGVAIGTMVVVGVAVLGSLTFLPALLSLLGKGTDRGRIPFLGKRQAAARQSRLWAAVVGAVVRRPLALGGLAAVALLALAAPLLTLHLEDAGIHDLPPSVPVVSHLLDIQRAFPGGPNPAQVVVTGGDLSSSQVADALTRMHAEVAASHGAIHEPITTAVFGKSAGHQVLVVSVPLAGSGTDTASFNALGTLRSQVLPATFGKVPGVSYAVGGLTAGNHDVDAQLASRTALVFCFVLGLAFLLLMITFRAVAIPALSICLNLLSVGAAYGLMTWIFQDGHLQGALGFTSYGGITPWLPLFMFVLLFGLSMDYHVFILSRIRELRQHGATALEAVTGGITSSAGVVTSAAVIMMAVFSIFASLSVIEFKLFGITMAAAILIDATVVRGVLLPAGLALLGERAWSLPRWPRQRRPHDDTSPLAWDRAGEAADANRSSPADDRGADRGRERRPDTSSLASDRTGGAADATVRSE